MRLRNSLQSTLRAEHEGNSRIRTHDEVLDVDTERVRTDVSYLHPTRDRPIMMKLPEVLRGRLTDDVLTPFVFSADDARRFRLLDGDRRAGTGP